MNMKETINDLIGQSKNDGIQEFQKYNFFLPFTLILMSCFFALAQKVFTNSDHWHNIASHNINTQKTKIMASGPITSWEIDVETVSDFIFLAPKSLQMVTAAMKLKDAYSLEGKLWPT